MKEVAMGGREETRIREEMGKRLRKSGRRRNSVLRAGGGCYWRRVVSCVGRVESSDAVARKLV
jgi:hypothetical protein